MHTDDRPVGTGIAVPADHGAGFDRDAGFDARRKDLLAIMPILLFEQLPAWHAHDPPSNSLLFERFVGRNTKLHFAAAPNQDHLPVVRTRHHISAAGKAVRGGVAVAVESRKLLAP